MESRTKVVLMIVCIGIPLLAAAIILASSQRSDRNNGDGLATPSPTAAQTEAIEPQAWQPYYGEFMTNASESHALWKHDQAMIYVQDRQLRYTSDGAAAQVLYEWEEAWPAQAWLNGEYLLIGTQLIAKGSEMEGYHGDWMAIQIEPVPEIISQDKRFFGPQEVLSVTIAEEPGLFFVTMLNGSGFSEYVFDPSRSDWMAIDRGLIDSEFELTGIPAQTYELGRFKDAGIFRLPEGPTVYTFIDDRGLIVHFQDPFYFVGRFIGYELMDVKLIPFLENTPQILGLFRNEAGEEAMSLLNYSFSSAWPVEPRVWEGDWQALNSHTFIRVLPEDVEVIQYKDDYYLDNNQPVYRKFPTTGAKWVSNDGSLLEYAVNGATQYMSVYDLVYTAEALPDIIWSSPMDNFTIKEEERPPWEYDYVSRQIPEWSFEEENTNAEIPEGLLEAVSEAHWDSDYGFAKTYRKFGNEWFVIVDRNFYEYKDEKLVRLGELPVTISVRVGDGFGGRGAMDFVRANDGWLVADTEASRVIKLNERLEVEAELHVPTPYELNVEGDLLRIDSVARRWTADKEELKLIEYDSQPFKSTAKMGKVEVEHFWEQQWYEDSKSGLTWYYLLGYLYQYHERKQEYRSFYIGYNENNQAQVRIIPFHEEVIVLLDRRLERFDRQGNWLSTLTFPRSEPDGIYDRTPIGEGSIVIDDEAGALYLVQGYRILRIDLQRNEVSVVFRQDYSDIGKLIKHEDHFYFMLRSDGEDRYEVQMDPAASDRMYTEVVEVDMRTRSIQRSIAKGFYDALELNLDAGSRPAFVLRKYK